MVEVVYALHPFEPENADEVAFSAGDAVLVVQHDDEYNDGWWTGTNPQGQTGLFPVAFTTHDRNAAIQNLNAVESTAAAAAAAAAAKTGMGAGAGPGHSDAAATQSVTVAASSPPIPAPANTSATFKGAPASETAGPQFSPPSSVDPVPVTLSQNPPVAPPVSDAGVPQDEVPVPTSPDVDPEEAAVHETFARRSLSKDHATGLTTVPESSVATNDALGQAPPAPRAFAASQPLESSPSVPLSIDPTRSTTNTGRASSVTGDGSDTEDESNFGSGHLGGGLSARAALAANAQQHRQTAQESQARYNDKRTARALRHHQRDEESRMARAKPSMDVDDSSRLSTALDRFELSDESDEEPTPNSAYPHARQPSMNTGPSYDTRSAQYPQPAAYPPPTPPLFSGPTAGAVGTRQSQGSRGPAVEAVTPLVPPAPAPQAQAQAQAAYARPPTPSHHSASIASSVHDRDVPDQSYRQGVPTSPESNIGATPLTQNFSRSGTPATTAGSVQPAGDPTEWSVAQVCQWARSKGWDEHSVVSKFAEQEISGDVLLELDMNMLKELDITAFGLRHKVAVAIRDLRRAAIGEGQEQVGSPTSPAQSAGHAGYPASQSDGFARSPSVNRGPPPSIHSVDRLAPAPQVHDHQAAYGGYGQQAYSPVTPQGPGSATQQQPGPTHAVQASWPSSSRGIQTTPPPVPRSRASIGSQRSAVPTVGSIGLGLKQGPGAEKPRIPSDMQPHTAPLALRSTQPAPISSPTSAAEQSPIPHATPAPLVNPYAPLDSSPTTPSLGLSSAGAAGTKSSPETDTSALATEPDSAPAGPADAAAAPMRETSSVDRLKPVVAVPLPENLPAWARQAAEKEAQSANEREQHAEAPTSTSASTTRTPTARPASVSSSNGPTSASSPKAGGAAAGLFGLRPGRGEKSLTRLMSKRFGLGQGANESPKPDLKPRISSPRDVVSSNALAHSGGTDSAQGNVVAANGASNGGSSYGLADSTSASGQIIGGGGVAAPAGTGTVLARVRPVDFEGWMKKKGERYPVWKPRYLAIKGGDLVILRDPEATKLKGHIPMKGARVLSDESIYPGKYAFKVVHEPAAGTGADAPSTQVGEKVVHYFSSDDPAVVRDWMKVLMKGSIARDVGTPVVSSYQAKTISLTEAQAMNPPPRPPSPTSLVNTQKATVRERTDKLTAKDAEVLTSFGH